MVKKVATAFRLYQDSIDQLDQLVNSPPDWLKQCAPGLIQDRTEVVERLIFLACRQQPFGSSSANIPQERKEDSGPAKRTATAKKTAKR